MACSDDEKQAVLDACQPNLNESFCGVALDFENRPAQFWYNVAGCLADHSDDFSAACTSGFDANCRKSGDGCVSGGDASSDDAPPAATCNNDGEAICGGVCTDIANDADNCGGCGQVCPIVADSTRACDPFDCVYTCNDGFVPSADGQSCACPAGKTPVDGKCRTVTDPYTCSPVTFICDCNSVNAKFDPILKKCVE